MSVTAPVPATIDDITPHWLSSVLRRPVIGMEVTDVIWGTSTKVLVHVTYGDSAEGEHEGEFLCVKAEFGEDAESAVGQTTTQREAQFYQDVIPRLDMPTARIRYAYGETEGRGVLVMEDLAKAGVSFGDPATPWTPERVAAGLDTLGRLHGSTWGSDFSDTPFLRHGSPDFKLALEMLFSPTNFEATALAPEAHPLPHALRDRDAVLRAYGKMFERDASGPHCVLHGDAHHGNAFISAQDEVVFIDWPTACLGVWVYDVSYFVAGALSVADRRAHERDLLGAYRDAVARAGGPRLDADQSWVDYQAHMVRGIIWATLPSAIQPPAAVRGMTERYAAAITDHHSIDLLG
ncbi:aminoglycoside phosphotransferase family protein [Nocardia brevicatena]|uniref:aminoglycoside phosphotransferase family protein n=1 Tax=Nocardia brevicatena TaxID=37327 RepID=UPI000306C92D|nr:aminoglycoside phosphotransferase family protein [Nocardia brevicatena]